MANQAQYAVGTILSTPTGGTYKVSDPNQFFAVGTGGYNPITTSTPTPAPAPVQNSAVQLSQPAPTTSAPVYQQAPQQAPIQTAQPSVASGNTFSDWGAFAKSSLFNVAAPGTLFKDPGGTYYYKSSGGGLSQIHDVAQLQDLAKQGMVRPGSDISFQIGGVPAPTATQAATAPGPAGAPATLITINKGSQTQQVDSANLPFWQNLGWTQAPEQQATQDIRIPDVSTLQALEAQGLSASDTYKDANGNIFIKGDSTFAQKNVPTALSDFQTSNANPDLTSGLLSQSLGMPKTTDDINALLAQNQQMTEAYLKATQPTPEMLDLQGQLQTVRDQANALQTSLAGGEADVMAQPIPMSFITGQQATMEQRANVTLQNLARIETSLTQRLGIAQSNQQMVAQGIQGAEGMQLQGINTALNIKSQMDYEQNMVFNQAMSLRQDSRQTLATVMDSLKGFDFTDLTSQGQQQVLQVAQAAGIPADLLVSGMSATKNQMLYGYYNTALQQWFAQAQLAPVNPDTGQRMGLPPPPSLGDYLGIPSTNTQSNLQNQNTSNQTSSPTPQGGYRTDRNSNPIAVAAAPIYTQPLDKAGIPYTLGDPFKGGTTIRFLPSPDGSVTAQQNGVNGARVILSSSPAIEGWYLQHHDANGNLVQGTGAEVLKRFGVFNHQQFAQASPQVQNAIIAGIYQNENGGHLGSMELPQGAASSPATHFSTQTRLAGYTATNVVPNYNDVQQAAIQNLKGKIEDAYQNDGGNMQSIYSSAERADASKMINDAQKGLLQFNLPGGKKAAVEEIKQRHPQLSRQFISDQIGEVPDPLQSPKVQVRLDQLNQAQQTLNDEFKLWLTAKQAAQAGGGVRGAIGQAGARGFTVPFPWVTGGVHVPGALFGFQEAKSYLDSLTSAGAVIASTVDNIATGMNSTVRAPGSSLISIATGDFPTLNDDTPAAMAKFLSIQKRIQAAKDLVIRNPAAFAAPKTSVDTSTGEMTTQ